MLLVDHIVYSNSWLYEGSVRILYRCGAAGLLQIDVTSQDESDHTNHHHGPGSKSFCGVLVGELEENHSWENHTDTRAHSAAHKSENKFNVGNENADGETENNETAGDEVEPRGWDVVGDQLCGADTLVGFTEEQAVNTGPTGEHHQGEGESHRDTES